MCIELKASKLKKDTGYSIKHCKEVLETVDNNMKMAKLWLKYRGE